MTKTSRQKTCDEEAAPRKTKELLRCHGFEGGNDTMKYVKKKMALSYPGVLGNQRGEAHTFRWVIEH